MAKSDRKDEVIKTLLLESTKVNDWNMLQMTLKQCWNKTRLFQESYSKDGDSLLHITCRHNYVQSTKILIEHGLNTDYRNSNGDTCLHIASKNGNKLILNLLFETGANSIAKNNNDKQPVDMTENQDIKEMIRQYSVKNSELQLMRKFNTLKEMVSEQEVNERCESDKDRYYLDLYEQKFPSKDILERIDSGICSDIESDKFDSSRQTINEKSNKDSVAKPRVRSLELESSCTKADLRRRRCVSGSPELSRSSILTPEHRNCTESEQNVFSNTKNKVPLKVTKSFEHRKRRPIDKSARRNRLSLPVFHIEGSTESYV